MADYFSPKYPKSVEVIGGKQSILSIRTSSTLNNPLYITNNGDVPVYLGFTDTRTVDGNAKPNHGITVFPKSVFVFDDPIPSCCSVWATCEEGSTAVIGIQE